MRRPGPAGGAAVEVSRASMDCAALRLGWLLIRRIAERISGISPSDIGSDQWQDV